MSYKIKITETIRVPAVEKRWLQINASEFGWVELPEGATTTRERELLSQEVDLLDLAAVIKAVNGL